MWIGLHELEKVHCTSSTQQKAAITAPDPTESLGHHEPMCVVPQPRIKSTHGPEALAKQTAVT